MIDERTKPTGPTAADAATPQRGPVYSEAFDFGKGRRWKFRLLDNLESMWAIAYAERMVLEQLREVFDGESEDLVLGMMREHAPNGDLQTFWTELLALQATLSNEDGSPVVDGSPEERGRQLADDLSPVERHQLARMYEDFAEQHDPTDFSDAQILAIVEDGKKNLDPSYWRQYGWNTLLRSMTTMARLLVEAMGRANALQAELDEATQVED